MKIKQKILFYFLIASVLPTFCVGQLPLQPRRVRPVPTKGDSIAIQSHIAWIAEKDSIEAFLIHGWAADPSEQGLQGFKVKKRGVFLKDELKKTCLRILNDKKLYTTNTLLRRCEFLPHIGFRFKSDTTYMVLLALNCDTWRFYGFAANPLAFDADEGHQQALTFAEKVFGKTEMKQLFKDESDFQASWANPFERNPAAVSDSNSLNVIPPVYRPRTEQAITAPAEPNVLTTSATVVQQSIINEQNTIKNKIEYIVGQRESLEKIAKNNKVSVEDLRNWNQLKTDKLEMFQKLIIYLK